MLRVKSKKAITKYMMKDESTYRHPLCVSSNQEYAFSMGIFFPIQYELLFRLDIYDQSLSSFTHPITKKIFVEFLEIRTRAL